MVWLSSLLVASLWGGCSEPTAPTGPESASETRDTLVVASLSDVGQLMSPVVESASDHQLLEALSVYLVDYDFDCSIKKRDTGWAKSWEWNDDGTVLRMELRDNLTWEDGTQLTVEDLAFTYDLAADPAVASPRHDFTQHMRPDARPKVIDDTHIEWHFTRPYDRDTQVSHTNLQIVPKHRLNSADRGSLRGHELARKPLSYGPWRIALWEPSERLILEPNPNFGSDPSQRARLNRVIFRHIPEYASRLIELEAGNVDMMESLLVADADRIRESHPEIRLHRRGWRSTDYIGYNMKNELFTDVRVRRAIGMAADVDGMIEQLLTSRITGEKYARRAISTVTPELCGVHNDDIQPLSHSVEQAKQLLTEAGWADSDGDGVLDKDGKRFSFTLSTNTGNKRRADIAVIFQAQMKAVGIEVNIEQIETNTLFENLRTHQFDAGLAGWSAALYTDPSELWTCDKPEAPREFNFTHYCNPEVDELIERGLQTPDPRESAPIWKEVQQKIYDDQPYLFLWWLDEIVAVHERFENAQVNVLSPRHRLHTWEVAADKVKYPR